MPTIGLRSQKFALCPRSVLFPVDRGRAATPTMNGPADIFESHRARLFGIAYRMLGSRADAEDVLQDAYLRWHETTGSDIQSPTAFLITVTSRLCLDRLRQSNRRRTQDIGPGLPEPIVEDSVPSPEQQFELACEISVGFLAVLERLGPEEWAAFLLREVFEYDYPEVAQMLGKSEAACRQLIHRSRTHLRDSHARFAVTRECHERILEKFFAAMGTGDRQAILALLAEEVEYLPDAVGQALLRQRPQTSGTKLVTARRAP